ncbi:putative MFS family arabinose efflux permease [Streptomyces griseochromogenes]|uniref:Permease n=1 Tax=Streptomyces griseochromogenes TaxID=68214 RepID=A0A1B1ANQ0_9ACTN|nr:MFS transporter [Streptomyces griseochromogenes]ANP48189.1 permease [Streptomyces griseochromogenes]MBP2050891.1 putative MFS family arabinose efflux permease [Streptomyces griseochromogenes]
MDTADSPRTTPAPPPAAAIGPAAPPMPAASLRLLRAAGFVSNFDRFCITPMLLLIGSRLGVPLTTVMLAASGYFLAYGLMQPVWGLASDRLGRVRVMRISLTGAAVAALCSVIAPGATVLIVARVAAGAFFAASIAASITYVGDTVPAAVRQRPLSELMTAFALGTAVATVVAGALAHYISWRLVFALPGLIAAYLVVALRRLPEPPRAAPGALLAPFKVVLSSRWQWYVMAVAMLEGAVLLGFLTYIAPALEAQGASATLAGAVSALYGVGSMAAAQMVKRLVGRWTPVRLIVVGGAQMAVAFGFAAASRSVPALVGCALLLGGGWSFMHSTIQSWATTLAPAARATGVAMFGVALYVGSALASAFAAGPAEHHAYRGMFLTAAVLTVPLTVAAAVGRARYRS